MKRYRLVLKPIDSDNPETIRIYSNVKDACERLNIYLNDFFETIEILKEKGEIESESLGNMDSNIEFVHTRIEEVTASMKDISETMSALVAMEEI